MKLMFFNDFRLGVLRGEEVVDVTSVADSVPRVGPHDIIAGVIEHFDTFRPKLEDAAKGARAFRSAACRSARRCRVRATSSAWP